MLSPVRENTLGLHVNQLKWIGGPFVFLLVVNLGLLLYAVWRPVNTDELFTTSTAEVAVEPEPPDVIAAETGLAVLSSAQSKRLEQELKRKRGEYKKAAKDSQRSGPTVETSESKTKADSEWAAIESFENELASVGREIVTTSQVISRPHRWLVGWHDRVAAWQSTANSRATGLQRHHVADTLPDDVQSDRAAARHPHRQVASAVPPRSDSRRRLLVRNPASNRGAVTFIADAETISLEPGQERGFAGMSPRQVMFHRGGKFGNASYTLHDGEYHFAVTESGWALVRIED